MSPERSVVVAARNGPAALGRLAAALDDELRSGRTELVVVATPGTEVPDRPSVLTVPCPASSSLPALRAAGLLVARGDVIALTRDLCVPEPGWLDRLASTLEREAAAAAGGVIEVPPGAAWADRVSHRLEYTAFRPGARAGAVTALAATNVAYSRAKLLRHRALVENGYREGELHAVLAAAGERLVLDPGARVRLDSARPSGFHLAQRFHAGRVHAAERRARRGRRAGILHALATPALPAVLAVRLFGALRAGGDGAARAAWGAIESVPLLLSGVVGELVGALAGPGASEERLA